MTPRADLLDEAKPPGKIKYVAAASGALLPVIGVGNAKVKGANGELVGLGNVLLVKGLSANLLSVRRLQKSKAEVTFGPTSCRAKLGKKVLWSLEEETSCIKDLWQLPIIPWNGKTPTAATTAAAKATAGGDATAPTDGVLEAVKKVQQQQTHGEVLAGVDASAAWAKASSRSGEADWETWHERLCHVNFPMLQKLVKDGSLKGLEVKGGLKEIGSCPTCLETKFSKFPFNSTTGPAKTPLALVHMDVTREEALNGPNGEKWKASEDEEFGSLIENETWDLCDLPPGKKAITSKMIYRHKVLLAIAALLGWKIRQMDIVTAFLNGIILEEVYMKQPEGLDDGSGREKDEILMLLVYVDDILLFSASTVLLDSAEQMLEMQFKCSKMDS
ncbi:hypothetical protein CLOM_g21292 [Closterium sp. NIES-68]|nr:hypothetical protein CLOM_g21292 [Closterium sp. NIES-68]